MKLLKPLIWAVAGGVPLCAATFWHGAAVSPSPSVAVAQTTDPDANSADEGIPMRRGGGGGGARILEYLRAQGFSQADITNLRQRQADAWNGLMDFMKQNSPNRYLLLNRQDLRAESPARIRLLQRWQNLEQQKSQPALYDLMVQQFQTEDRMIGLAAQLRVARNHGDQDLQAQLRQQIHDEAARLIDLNLRQRAMRIDNARKLLAQEQSDLNKDTQNRMQLADERATQVLRQTERDFTPTPDATPVSPTNP